jgi:hypothetical protein
MIEITVSDNGIGIAAENLTRIFSHGFTPSGTVMGLDCTAVPSPRRKWVAHSPLSAKGQVKAPPSSFNYH